MTALRTNAVAETSSGSAGHIPHKVCRSTPEEMERECLGTIAGTARDIERSAMDGKVDAMKVHFDFMKVQMRRLETIMGTVQQKARMI